MIIKLSKAKTKEFFKLIKNQEISTYNEAAFKIQFLTQFKQIIEQNNEAVLELSDYPKLIEMLVESYQNDFKSMIHLIENDALNASEVESMIEKANHILKVMQILNLEDTDIYNSIHSELDLFRN